MWFYVSHAAATFLLVTGAASLAYGVIAYLRNALAMPAAVVEQLPVRAAMRRSKVLVAGRKGRIFLLFLLLWVLYMVAGSVEVPFSTYAIRAHGMERAIEFSCVTLLQNGIVALLGPLFGIAIAVFYFDERVRREAFDVELLLEKASAEPPITG